MAQNNHTPVSFWLGCPLGELRRWIEVNNKVVESMQRKQRKD